MSPRVWLITGANSGLGLALTRYVLSQGDKVVAAARDIAKIPASIKEAHALSLDMSASEAEIHSAAKKALSAYGHIDVLVNNAGYSLSGPIEELSVPDIHTQFQTNVFGPVTLIKALLPTFRAQKSGQILNVSSIAGFAGGPVFGAYNATKAALDAFSEALAPEVAPFGIKVRIVVPGFFPTNFLTRAGETLPASERSLGIYTLPSQGYNAVNLYHKRHVEQGQVGDVDKAAARIYEVVSGTGLAQGLMEKHNGIRVPLGPDCGARMLKKLQLIEENVKVMEPVWSSTDVEKERLHEFAQD